MPTNRDACHFSQSILKCLKISWKEYFHILYTYRQNVLKSKILLAKFPEIRKFPENWHPCYKILWVYDRRWIWVGGVRGVSEYTFCRIRFMCKFRASSKMLCWHHCQIGNRTDRGDLLIFLAKVRVYYNPCHLPISLSESILLPMHLWIMFLWNFPDIYLSFSCNWYSHISKWFCCMLW